MGVQLLVIVSIAVHVFVTSSSADDITFCVVPEHVRKEVDTLHASYGTEQCTETKDLERVFGPAISLLQ